MRANRWSADGVYRHHLHPCFLKDTHIAYLGRCTFLSIAADIHGARFSISVFHIPGLKIENMRKWRGHDWGGDFMIVIVMVMVKIIIANSITA